MQLTPILQGILKVYPELKGLFETENQIEQWEIYVNKAKCLIPNFKIVTDDNLNNTCDLALPLFMVTAHLAIIGGLGEAIGITASNGSVASSSVGDVSISFNTPAYANTKNPNFNYWWSLTKYGAEYLAWLETQSGLRYVNN